MAQGHDDLCDALGRLGRGGSGASAQLCAPGGSSCEVAIPPLVEPTFRAGQFPADVLEGVACQVAVDGPLSAWCWRLRHGGILGSVLPSWSDRALVSRSGPSPHRVWMPRRAPLWCEPSTAPAPVCALRLHVTALGRGQSLWGTGVGPRAVVGTQLAAALQFVSAA